MVRGAGARGAGARGRAGDGLLGARPWLASMARAGLARPPTPQWGLGRGLSDVGGSLAPPAIDRARFRSPCFAPGEPHRPPPHTPRPHTRSPASTTSLLSPLGRWVRS